MKNPLLLLLSILLIFSNQSFAEEAKSKTTQPKSSNSQKEIEDPDLKLSIEELKKKYPIGWLKERYGDFNTADCVGGPTDDYYEAPDNLICRFTKDGHQGKKKSFRDFSTSEIKSAFIQGPIILKKTLGTAVQDFRIWQIIGITLKFFEETPESLLSSKEMVLRNFVTSSKILDPVVESTICRIIKSDFDIKSLLICRSVTKNH